MLSTIPNFIDIAFQKIENLNIFISAVFLILMVDVVSKYFKYKKNVSLAYQKHQLFNYLLQTTLRKRWVFLLKINSAT